MYRMKTVAQESAEDIFFGQLVMNWARWFVIGAAAVLVLVPAERTDDLLLGIWPIVGLMAVNFYLHGRRLVERPANSALIVLASILDVTIITGIVVLGLGTGSAGVQSPFFLAYYPVVLAFAFVMRPAMTAAFTTLVLATYAAASLLAEPNLFADGAAAETLTARLITLAAMGGLGAYYWRIQRDRRRRADAETADAAS